MFLAHFFIKNRLSLIVLVGALTIFMGYHASKVELTHDLVTAIPEDDPEGIFLHSFREEFGEDGNLLAVGLADSSIFLLDNFNKFKTLCDTLAKIPGVDAVVSLPGMQRMEKNTQQSTFLFADIFPDRITNQQQLDSLVRLAREQHFYAGQIFDQNSNAIATLIFIDEDFLNSSRRLNITQRIHDEGAHFSQATGIALHYAGLPFVRSTITERVMREMKIFLPLSMLIAAIALLIFFRSFRVMFFAMIIIGIAVVWSVGTISLLGFKMTLLSGMIPPIMVVIGIPDSIYLINKYHAEYALHGNKILALMRMVCKVGLATFLTNLTTAIGFLVLLGTDIPMLSEFGLVAGINVMATFFVSLILILGIFSWMPPPSPKHLQHLNFRIFDKILRTVNQAIHYRKQFIYISFAIVISFAIWGMLHLNVLSYMSDDLPEQSTIKKDLKFFEAHFGGVMPLEIVVDTHKPRGVMNYNNLKKIASLDLFLSQQPSVSKPISFVDFVKGAKQAFYNNNPMRYELPNQRERVFMQRYINGQLTASESLRSFVDSTFSKMRISMRIADMGSEKMDSLINKVIIPKMDALFDQTALTARVTGTTPVYIRGNHFLIKSLRQNLLLAFLLIAITMGFLFNSVKMMLISLIPNCVPMMITAALMGYTGTPLKPSTVLIFSIIFGISVDFSIHFLAKYRQELYAQKFAVAKALTTTIMEVGKSMIYTSIVLFAGFIIFAFSSFGGTVALGVLTSTTLVMSVVTNLVLLPTLLLAFNYGKDVKGGKVLVDKMDTLSNSSDQHEKHKSASQCQ